jgi:anti-anti-sigma factor
MVAQIHPHVLVEEQIGEVTLVKLNRSEVLDDRLIRSIAQRLFNLIEHSSSRRLVLDLGGVNKLSTAMLGTFMSLNRMLRADGGSLVLCGVDARLREIFGIFKLPQVLRICDNEQEALQAF